MKIPVNSVKLGIHDCGPYNGSPALFIYTSGPSAYKKFSNVSPQLLVDRAKATMGSYKNLTLVIRGSEPTEFEGLLDFIDLTKGLFQVIELTTDGTNPRFYERAAYMQILDQFTTSLSPRPWPVAYPDPDPEVFSHATSIKFMLSADPTSKYHTIPDWALPKNSNRLVYVSPITLGAERKLMDQTIVRNTDYTIVYASTNNLMVNLPVR